MADKRFKVRVFVKPVDPRDGGREEPSRAFEVTASNPDRAAALVRARLDEQGAEVLAVSHAPERSIIATIGREPRKGPPTMLVANVARERPRPAPRKGAGR